MFAGVDIGGTSIKIGLFDDEVKELLDQVSVPFVLAAGPEQTVCGIADRIKEMITLQGAQSADLKGIGLSVPGSVSSDGRILVHACNLEYYNEPLPERFARQFDETCIAMGNDADMAALAELRDGIFQGKKTAILVTLGTGIGGGIILNGELYRGGNGRGTEIGHMTICEDGEPCGCGNSGCVETVCSASWIVRQGNEEVRLHPEGMLAGRCAGRVCLAEDVFFAARENDPTCLQIIDAYVEHLSSALASYIALLDPEIIGLGGGVSHAGEFLLEPLRKRVREKNFFRAFYPIEQARFGNTAGMRGAAFLAKQLFLNKS